jgi:hypothetical protein
MADFERAVAVMEELDANQEKMKADTKSNRVELKTLSRNEGCDRDQ